MTRKSVQGFTIVELLIVIVVIAILAAITVAAYNGIQNRSRTSAGSANASSVLKKAELYNSLYSGYPTYCQLVTNTVAPTGTPTTGTGLGASTPCVAGGASTGTEVTIVGISGLTMIAVTGTTSSSGSVVTYIKCPAVGAKVGYWDSTIGTPAIVYKTIGDQTGC